MSDANDQKESMSELERAAAELDWIAVHGYGDTSPKNDEIQQRALRKFKENPFIPIGCLATAGILGLGLTSMMKGNQKHSQLFMRMRVTSQGLTVAALVIGAIFGTKSM